MVFFNEILDIFLEKAERKALTGGRWVTINGSKVYIKGGKVVAGKVFTGDKDNPIVGKNEKIKKPVESKKGKTDNKKENIYEGSEVNKFKKQFKSYSNSQLNNYLLSPNNDVKQAAQFLLKERNVSYITKEEFDNLINLIKENKIDTWKLSNAFGGVSDYDIVKNMYDAFGGKDNIGKIKNLEISLSDDSVEIELSSDNIERMSRIYDYKNKIVTNYALVLNENKRGKGIGTKIFNNQIEAYKKGGYKKIESVANRTKYQNGYYTWARLGYDFDSEKDAKKFNELIKSSKDKDINSVKSLSELMSFSEGRDFWKDKGFKFNSKFDLSIGSKSLFLFNEYIKSKK